MLQESRIQSRTFPGTVMSGLDLWLYCSLTIKNVLHFAIHYLPSKHASHTIRSEWYTSPSIIPVGSVDTIRIAHINIIITMKPTSSSNTRHKHFITTSITLAFTSYFFFQYK